MEQQSFDTEIIQLIKRQTMLKEEEIVTQLMKHNGNHMDVISEYLGIPKSTPKPITSVNQEIYRQIRNKMFELDRLKELDLQSQSKSV